MLRRDRALLAGSLQDPAKVVLDKALIRAAIGSAHVGVLDPVPSKCLRENTDLMFSYG
jgi:hypothetical protein